MGRAGTFVAPRAALLPAPIALQSPSRPGRRATCALAGTRACSGEQGDGASVSDDDWRSFRARLVAQEQGASQEASAAGGETWAYNAGNLVEQGSLLMGGSELEFGFGLRQQYFHKCVLLILAHKDDFTRGVIVNRPTNRRTAKGWRIWYGGDVQGITAADYMQEAICLHKCTNAEAVRASTEIIKGIYTCSLEQAEILTDEGHATPEDFWPLIGYAGWGPGQLQVKKEPQEQQKSPNKEPCHQQESPALLARSGGRWEIDALNPTPYTLSPTPYTLSPTPYTLSPALLTRSGGRWRLTRVRAGTSLQRRPCFSGAQKKNEEEKSSTK